VSDETYALPPVTISRREAFSFGLARKLLAHYESTPLHLDMRSVLDKIAESMEGDITIEPDRFSEHVGVLPVITPSTPSLLHFGSPPSGLTPTPCVGRIRRHECITEHIVHGNPGVALQAARVHFPKLRNLRRHQRLLGLRAARLRA
jgi:hypothetical protein